MLRVFFTISFSILTAATLTAQPQSNQATAEADRLTIKAVGDIVLGTNYPQNRLPPRPYQTLFSSVQPLLQGADILFGNYESTLTDHPDSSKKMKKGRVYAFRAPPSYGAHLKQAGFDILTIANNHSNDFKSQGYKDTARAIQEHGMEYTGPRERIAVLVVNQIRVAFIGFSYIARHNLITKLDDVRRLVKLGKAGADLVVVTFHGGAEGGNYTRVSNKTEYFLGENRGNVVAFARTAIDTGADLVLGHGPHVPRAFELYKNRFVAYSLGNFMGYGVFSTRGYKGYSLVLEVELNRAGEFQSGQIIPLQLNQLGIPEPDPKKKTIRLIKELTRSDFPGTPLRITSDGKIYPDGDVPKKPLQLTPDGKIYRTN